MGIFISIYPEEYDCDNCLEAAKKFKGCKNEAIGPGIEILGHKIRRCPIKLVNPIIWDWISLYAHYINGHLFYGGGIAEQPIKYLQVMAFIKKTLDRLKPEDKKHG